LPLELGWDARGWPLPIESAASGHRRADMLERFLPAVRERCGTQDKHSFGVLFEPGDTLAVARFGAAIDCCDKQHQTAEQAKPQRALLRRANSHRRSDDRSF